MLQSPEFLFRVENGTNAACRPYEAASKLSYFLWDSMPDAALFRSAANGELGTPTGFERVARRMLADPRAHRSVDEYVSEWLRLDRVLSAVKDRRAYPQFTPELAQAMAEETRRLIADAVWNNRNFLDIFTADYSFVTPTLPTSTASPLQLRSSAKCPFPRIPIAPASLARRRSSAHQQARLRHHPPPAVSSCGSSFFASTFPIRLRSEYESSGALRGPPNDKP